MDIRGIPVRLFDTAGLRSASGEIEEEGIRRTRTIIAAADLVLYVVAADLGLTDDDTARIAEIESQVRPEKGKDYRDTFTRQLHGNPYSTSRPVIILNALR